MNTTPFLRKCSIPGIEHFPLKIVQIDNKYVTHINKICQDFMTFIVNFKWFDVFGRCDLTIVGESFFVYDMYCLF